ncbi:MAG: HlyC/CorC family transporter [Anaerolineales bacterium]|nr:HlyC/CorC family transporter [Anaerolineales bacterium]
MNITCFFVGVLFILIDLLTVGAFKSLHYIRLARILNMEEQGSEKASKTLSLLREPAQMTVSDHLWSVLLKVLIGGSLFCGLQPLEQTGLKLWESLAILLGVVIILWLLEFSVDGLVEKNPETWALRLTPLSSFLIFTAKPLTFLPVKLANKRGEFPDSSDSVTEEDVISLVDEGQKQGTLEQEESKMISSILELNDTMAREIMIPRIDMFTLDVNKPLSSVMDEILTSGYSRIPVHDGNVDNILGFLYTKDILKLWKDGSLNQTSENLLRKANFTPETKVLDELLEEMQSRRIHIAIVIDEFGGVSGLVTLEDIVEEIFGEIRDEYDDREELLFQQISDSEYVFHGRINLHEFNEITGCHLESSDTDTLGGYIYNHIGRVPHLNESIEVGVLNLSVEKIIGRRIYKVRAVLKNRSPKSSETIS